MPAFTTYSRSIRIAETFSDLGRHFRDDGTVSDKTNVYSFTAQFPTKPIVTGYVVAENGDHAQRIVQEAADEEFAGRIVSFTFQKL